METIAATVPEKIFCPAWRYDCKIGGLRCVRGRWTDGEIEAPQAVIAVEWSGNNGCSDCLRNGLRRMGGSGHRRMQRDADGAVVGAALRARRVEVASLYRCSQQHDANAHKGAAAQQQAQPAGVFR